MSGRLTLPIETGLGDRLPSLIESLGVDAVRNSDGTLLPENVAQLATKIYATYFVGRGDQAWALANPDSATRIFLMSDRVTAMADGPLDIDVLAGYFTDQVAPDLTVDRQKYWQVINRSTGEAVPTSEWSIEGLAERPLVRIAKPNLGHVYTVNFLAVQTWDPTQMYNYLTNDWASDPSRVKERPYDVRHEETWAHVRAGLDDWLVEHPEVDVVRFTTFFYHFTLVYSDQAREKFVDWFGYSASVSVPALEDFAKEHGYELTPEDFVDEGYYNSPFRQPRPEFLDWLAFEHRFVTGRVKDLVAQVHASGKEAMMFLGDNWIGTEPYGPHFADTGMDAVVGSVGSAATCRMISDIPGVRYTEGRFLPYFFPDVFRPGGDPVREANESWVAARRAIVRSPLDRMGYGGYLSLAVQFPDFMERMAEIVAEFRELHDECDEERPESSPIKVGVLNAWGKLRSWQTHMVAHALWYRQTYSYLGVLEALAGLPFEVEFLSFADALAEDWRGVDVLLNVGAADTAFSGGSAWADPELAAAVRRFVAAGGGLIGVGDPSYCPSGGVSFQLADVLGVDRELGWGLSTNRYPQHVQQHFIVEDLGQFDVGEGTANIVPCSADVSILRDDAGAVLLSANDFGAGRACYAAGLPSSVTNHRLLHRAICWVAGREDEFVWVADDPRVEVAHYREAAKVLAFNNASEPVTTDIHGADGSSWRVELPAMGRVWLSI